MKTEELADKLIELALKKGASQAEVFYKTSRRLSAEVKGGKPETSEFSISRGYSLRIIMNGRLGFSYSTQPEEWGKVAEAALESARWTEKDNYHDLPLPAISDIVPEIFDPEIDSLLKSPHGKDSAIEKALLIERSAMSEGRIKRLRTAQASFSSSETSIINSKGMSLKYSATACMAQVMAVAEDSGESQMGWGFESSRFLSEISFERVGNDAARRAVMLLGAQRMPSVKASVILDNSVSAEFLGIFSSLLSAESVQKGKSLLKGRLGQKIMNELISIVDDGLLKARVGSRPFDDEGVPVQQKVLVENGVLKGFMHNTYTARRAGTASTGNAVRAGYSGIPTVGPTNLFIKPLSTTDDILSACDRGLLVTEAMGVHTANPISGDFSVGVSGLWLEGGKIKHPIKEAVISGNILEFFGGIVAAGNDLTFYGNIGAPSLIVGSMDISG